MTENTRALVLASVTGAGALSFGVSWYLLAVGASIVTEFVLCCRDRNF
jgi:hypothetical protein